MPGLLRLGALAAFVAAPALAQTPLESPSPEPSGRFGAAVSSLGTLPGDATRDVLVGAPGETVGGASAAGRAYAVSGADGSVLLTLEPASPIANGQFGSAVLSGGDLDGDGVADPVVGAMGETVGTNERAGRVYVFSGADGSLLHTLESPFPVPVGLFGSSLARLADRDGDGVNEIVVGAPQEQGDPAAPNPENSGAYHIFSGATGALISSASFPQEDARLGGALTTLDLQNDGTAEVLASVAAWSGSTASGGVTVEAAATPYLLPPAPATTPAFGASLDAVGDRDGDDVSEVLVSATDSVFVFSGASGTLLLSVASPEGPGGAFGWSAAGAGNVDEAGAGDLIVGAISESVRGIANAGRVYLFSGDDGTVLRQFTSPMAQTLGQFGYAVALAGAVDGDNTADQIVGAPGETVDGHEGAGRAYLLLSATAVAGEPAPNAALALRAHPNPASGTLRLAAETSGRGTLIVTDALGREVARAVAAPGRELALDVSGWAPGLYLARLTSEAGTATRTITVVR
ncbi:MAG TPA: T9SS type A sorting domain-containing protein [Bacteroidetes bacterium]|nr:T9SS type A sorting domain-containing protein [Bacteroidota bacterium]